MQLECASLLQSDGGTFGSVKNQPHYPNLKPSLGDAADPCGKFPNSVYFKHYALYIIASFGSVSNLIVIAVIFFTKRVKKSVSGVFLLGLTFADTVVLISEQVDNLTRTPIKGEKIFLSETACGFVALLKYSSRFAATVIVLSISLNRLVVILNPMRCHGFHKIKYAAIQICIIFFISLVTSSVYAFSIGTSRCGCKANTDPRMYRIAVVVIDVVLCDIVASVLISVFSIYTVYRFRRYGKKLTDRQDSITSVVRRQDERHATVLLLTVALTFVLLRLPYTLTWTPLKFMSNTTELSTENKFTRTERSMHEALPVLQILSLTNHAINLYLYCLCSRGFRNDIYRLFSGERNTWRDMRSFKMKTMSTKTQSRSNSKIVL